MTLTLWTVAGLTVLALLLGTGVLALLAGLLRLVDQLDRVRDEADELRDELVATRARAKKARNYARDLEATNSSVTDLLHRTQAQQAQTQARLARSEMDAAELRAIVHSAIDDLTREAS